MSANDIAKIELPLAPTPDIMELLIKAKHFLEHAMIHAQTGNSFDSMIAIHSLDNSIEYLLRILIKHLEIEEKTGKTINTPEFGRSKKSANSNASLQATEYDQYISDINDNPKD